MTIKNRLKSAKNVGIGGAVALAVAALIVPFEGSVKNEEGLHVAYKDPVGIITWCYGQTGPNVKVGDTFTEEECMAFLKKHTDVVEKDIEQLAKVEFESIYQKAAYIDFVYNVGATNYQKSTLLRLFNQKKYDEACDQLTRWVYASGKKLNGLVRRRKEEKEWCNGIVPQYVKDAYEDSNKQGEG